jgi:hypothetical protein
VVDPAARSNTILSNNNNSLNNLSKMPSSTRTPRAMEEVHYSQTLRGILCKVNNLQGFNSSRQVSLVSRVRSTMLKFLSHKASRLQLRRYLKFHSNSRIKPCSPLPRPSRSHKLRDSRRWPIASNPQRLQLQREGEDHRKRKPGRGFRI